MLKKFFCHTFPIIFALTAVVLYDGHTDDWPDNNDLPSSVYASTHGAKEWFNDFWKIGNPHTRVHVHCIAAAHGDRDGYYNLWAQIEEAPNAPWWVYHVGFRASTRPTELLAAMIAVLNRSNTPIPPDSAKITKKSR